MTPSTKSGATCRSCGASELTTFLSLGAMPLADGLLKPEDLDAFEPRFPLDVALCRGCSLVQILETVPPEVLFCRDYPYFSSFSETLLAHSRRNVEALVASRGLGPKSLAVELASNDGYLLQYFVKRGVPVLGIDPAEGPVAAARARGIPTLQAFFGRDLALELRREGKRADVIVANNVLAHVADLNGFVAGIALLLKDDGVAVIECPYVKDLVDDAEFDTIYHEHLCYFSVTALDALFRRHGLSLVHLDRLPIHGGSLRLYVEPAGGPGRAAPASGPAGGRGEAVARALEAEARAGLDDIGYYAGFAARVEAIRAGLRTLLSDLKGCGKRIAGYGAAAKGAVLLNYAGIDGRFLDYIVDRNVHKQGRYVPGVRLPIHDPARLLDDRPDYVLLLPWNLRNEVLRQQREYRVGGGRFIIPIPHLEIV